MHAEGLPHDGVELCFGGARHRIDLHGLTGKRVMVYGQTEVTRDLMDARAAAGPARPSTRPTTCSLHDFDGAAPTVRYRHGRRAARRIECDFIAGCDGFHGVCRASVPAAAHHDVREGLSVRLARRAGRRAAGVARADLRQHASAASRCAACAARTRSRYYVQCALDDERRATGPTRRSGTSCARACRPERAAQLVTGPSLEKSIAPLRSFVAEPMRFGRLFLAGDAAHIVPPTGAKGLNLAASDVGLPVARR